jgi:hypothetical protein
MPNRLATKLSAVSLALIALAGCGGVREGQEYMLKERFVFVRREDVSAGGSGNRVVDMLSTGQTLFFEESEPVKVSDVDGKYVRVVVIDGKHRNAAGWTTRDNLKDVAPKP